MTKTGIKLDKGKRKYQLLPFDALDEVVDVLTFGASKYGERNWELGIEEDRLMGAALRHLSSHIQGNKNDSETGLSHISHAVCCLLFISALEKRK